MFASLLKKAATLKVVELSLSTWRNFAYLVTQNAPSEDSDQIARIRSWSDLRWARMSEDTFSDVATQILIYMYFSSIHNFKHNWYIVGNYWKRLVNTFLSDTSTKTRLFRYIENFTTKKGKFTDKKIWYFSYLLKNRLWVLVRTASARRF